MYSEKYSMLKNVLGEASCHVMRTLKKPIERPKRWGRNWGLPTTMSMNLEANPPSPDDYMPSCGLIAASWVTLMKEIKEDTDGKESHVHGLEVLILLKCPYYAKPSINSMQSLINSSGIFHRDRKNNPKICMEPHKTRNSQSSPEKEQSWKHHTSWFHTRLQSNSNKNSMVLA